MAHPLYSLNGKDYENKEIVCGEGYEMVKLGDIAELKNGKQLDRRNIIPGIYPVYAGGLTPIGYHNEYNGENSTLITETGRCGFVQFDKNKFWHSQCFTVKNENQLINSYLFNICKLMENIFSKRAGGSVQQHIRASQFKDMLIPIPKSPERIQYWVDRISAPYNEKNTKQERIKELETIIQSRIKSISEGDCDEVELGSVCEINPESLKTNQYEYVNYIDISSVKDESINNIQKITENFPSRAKRIVRKNDILFSTVRPNLKGYVFMSEEIVNAVASTGFAVLRCKKYNPKYIYSLMKDDKITEYLIHNSTGTSYPAVNSSVFKNIKIRIPKNKQLIQEMEPMFQEIETLQNEVKVADELYKKYIQDLSREAFPETKVEVVEEPKEEKKPVKLKIVKVGKKKILTE